MWAVRLKNCQYARVRHCLVRNMGKSGIDLSGANVAAMDCEVTRTGSQGINVQGGDRKTLTPGECWVIGCHIHNVGRLDWMGGRAVTVGAVAITGHNRLHDSPTGAISYGGNEHCIELNEIFGVCIHYSDVGVIYTGRDWASRGNVVRWNYIHDVTNVAGHGSSAIYLDDCDSGDTVVGNIVYGGVGRGILLGGGRDKHDPRQHFHQPAGRYSCRRTRAEGDHARQAGLVESAGQMRAGGLPLAAVA